jgi:hypothetical protein
METEMSPQMQQFIEQMTQHHGVDLYAVQSQLWVRHPERQEALLISNIDGRRISVAHCVVQNECLGLDMDMVFLMDTHGEWFPMEVSYAGAVWDTYVFEAEVMGEVAIEDEKGNLILHQFTEFHATRWHGQGWLEHGQRYDLPVTFDMRGGEHGSSR